MSATRCRTGTSRACARRFMRKASTSPGVTAACMCTTCLIMTCRSHPPPSKTLSDGKGRIAMEGFVAKHVHDYQTGKISRLRLIEILTLAATSAGAGRAAGAEPTGLDVALVNHVSYTCPDFRKAADWYSKVFNLDQVGATDHDVALPFGKKGEKPYGVAANDVPLTHIICRTRPRDAPAGAGAGSGPPRRTAKAVIDHIALTV